MPVPERDPCTRRNAAGMPVERSDVEQDQPERRPANMVARRGGQLATQGAPPLTSDPMSIPPGQQVSPVANSPPMSSSSGGSSAQDVQGGDADDIGVSGTHPAARKRTQRADDLGISGTNPAAHKRTQHSPRMAPHLAVQGGEADDLGVSGTNPAAHKGTQHSPRVAPSTPRSIKRYVQNQLVLNNGFTNNL